MGRLVLASCRPLPEGDGDEEGLVERLRDRGVEARWEPWGAGPRPGETVVLRATWDYTDRPERFLSWCAGLPRLVNPYPAVAATVDKRYLLRYAARGIAIIPTVAVGPGDELPALSDELVIKPTVGAGSRHVARLRADDTDRVGEHLRAIHRRAPAALVQPYLPAVGEAGETMLVFFRGRYSHAFWKGPMLTDGHVGGDEVYLPEELGPAQPDPAVRRLAADCLAVAADDAGVRVEDLVYARVDIVEAPDGPCVLEAELIEPSLGFAHADAGALDRFADTLAGVGG